MIDIMGCELSAIESTWLNDPRVGGLILFSRNFECKAQLKALIKSIRSASETPLLIAVDHEGGRVQRFREGFTAIPPMRELGELFDISPEQARVSATLLGGVLASDLASMDIDFSFTPVLDLDIGNSGAVGDRAFHSDPLIVSELAKCLMNGLHRAGMAAVAKHFPGHGCVRADSHVELPVDCRRLDQIRQQDLIPFRALIDAGVEGIMPAHVVYEAIDSVPAGFSRYWIQSILRNELGFKGAVFSDDLSMQGAVDSCGAAWQRVELASAAGCDMLLVCNDHEAVGEVLERFAPETDPHRSLRLRNLRRKDDSAHSDFRHEVMVEYSTLNPIPDGH